MLKQRCYKVKLLREQNYVRPPTEAIIAKMWKLNKCVYGLADASHYWYLKFREELIKLGATPRQLDIFLYY